jgi:methionine-rich copper-binding protein CopC
VFKRKDLSNHKKTQGKLKCILLSEKSLRKGLYTVVFHYMSSKKGKIMETVKESMVARG